MHPKTLRLAHYDNECHTRTGKSAANAGSTKREGIRNGGFEVGGSGRP